MQVAVRRTALVAAAVGWVLGASGAWAQYYPPVYTPPDPYNTVYGYPGYGSPYSYPYQNTTSYGYGYATPYAYQGYGSPYAPPGYGYAYQPYPQYSSYTQPPYAPYASYAGYPAPSPYGPYYPGGPPPYAAGGGGAFTATATVSGASTALVSWTPVPGAVTYNVYQGVNGAGLTLASNATAGTSTTLPMGFGSYAFQVHALSPNGIEIGLSNVTAPLSAGTPYGGGPYYPSPYPAPYGPGGPQQPSPAMSLMYLSPNPVPITTTGQLTVTVVDAARLPLNGRTVVVISSRGPTDSITPSTLSPQTDPNGRVQFNVRGGFPGAATLTATVDGIPLAPLPVDFLP